MNIRTPDGIKIYCLPDSARCKCTGVSPEVMDRCPIINFDDEGDECCPSLCDEYDEDGGDTKTDCKRCGWRRVMARMYDLHWHGAEDCPMECGAKDTNVPSKGEGDG